MRTVLGPPLFDNRIPSPSREFPFPSTHTPALPDPPPITPFPVNTYKIRARNHLFCQHLRKNTGGGGVTSSQILLLLHLPRTLLASLPRRPAGGAPLTPEYHFGWPLLSRLWRVRGGAPARARPRARSSPCVPAPCNRDCRFPRAACGTCRRAPCCWGSRPACTGCARSGSNFSTTTWSKSSTVSTVTPKLSAC